MASKMVFNGMICFLLSVSGLSVAENQYDWYNDSYIHSHVSLGLTDCDIDFATKQIESVQIDAIQFHTHNLSIWNAINKEKWHDKLGFKKVATINHAGTWYPELYDKNPEKYIMRVNSDGMFAGRWNRKHICFNAPVFSEEIIPHYYRDLPGKLDPAQVWIDEAIITVNICYCEYCTAKYRKQYSVEPPQELTKDNWDQWEQWVKFHRDSFDEWMIKVGESIHEAAPDALVTFNHSYFVEQPEAPPSFIKNLSGDIHKDHLELGLFARYGGSGDLPFDLMPGIGSDSWAGVKPKSIETIYNDIALIIAHGGRWNIGEFPTNFTSLPVAKLQGDGYRRADIYLDRAKKGAEFARERKDFCRNTESVPYAALLHSASTHYSHVIVNTNTVNEDGDYGMTSDGHVSRNDVGRINSRVYWPNNKPIYDNLIGAYESLVENHIHFDFINEDQLQDRLQDYKMLVLAEQTYLEDATIAKIKEFVSNGGTILATGSSIKANMEGIFGVSLVSETPIENITTNINGEEVTFEKAWEVKAKDAKTMAIFDNSKSPLTMVNRYKKGKCIYIAGDFFKEYFDRSGYSYKPKGNDTVMRDYVNALYQELLPENGIEIQADPWYELTIRKDDNSATFVHIIDRSINWKQSSKSCYDTIKIILPLDFKPNSVTLQPAGNRVDFEYAAKRLELSLEDNQVNFYEILKIQ